MTHVCETTQIHPRARRDPAAWTRRSDARCDGTRAHPSCADARRVRGTACAGTFADPAAA